MAVAVLDPLMPLESPAAPMPEMARLHRDISEARRAQAEWAARPLAERLFHLRLLRHCLAEKADDLVRTVIEGSEGSEGTGRSAAEVLSSELLPLADACRFLEREAPRILAARRPGSEGRPAWLGGVDSEVRREPLGLVLILAPANYPLFLPAVQAIQALAAGNAVLLKPGRGGFAAARAFADLTALAGMDWRLVTVLPESPEAARAAIEAGPGKVFLTGSASTGRQVLADLARQLIPATAELSGCDALYILPGAGAADLERAAQAIRFGLVLNSGATCIAPRRVFIPRSLAPELEARVAGLAAGLPPVRVAPGSSATAAHVSSLLAGALKEGARLLAGRRLPSGEILRPIVLAGVSPASRLLREDLFAPIVSLVRVDGIEEALAASALCPYALGASVFGPEDEARALAGRVRAGVVTVNDVIVPTADPRLPFGGRGESGFGVTRGEEGLLEMTTIKVVSTRRGNWLPHLEVRRPGDEDLFRAWMSAVHGERLGARLDGVVRLVKAMIRRGKQHE